MDLPNVVGNRNHFVAIEDYADLLIRSHSGFTESDRPEVMQLLRQMVHEIADAMSTGAERGISQAAELILDQKYYESKKSRRARSNKAEADRRAEEEVSRQRRRGDPTIAEIGESMRHLNENISYHEKALDACRGQIRYLKTRPAFLMSARTDGANA